MSMFCTQCQEAAQEKGCSKKGVCGKSAEVANVQDLLTYLLKGIAQISLEAENRGIDQKEANRFITEGLFSTITNVNFDQEYFHRKIKEALQLREGLKLELEGKGWLADNLHDALT